MDWVKIAEISRFEAGSDDSFYPNHNHSDYYHITLWLNLQMKLFKKPFGKPFFAVKQDAVIPF